LDQDKVKELVRHLSESHDDTVRKFSADEVLEKFSDTTYRICRVPVQLELVLEMWQQHRILPEKLDDLFKYALSGILDDRRWQEEEHSDYPDTVARVAYKMLTEKRAYDPKSHELPQPLVEELTTRKLLVTHGDVMEFRHDKIRAYLAFLYFKDRWRSLLTDPKTLVDSNWDSMIEFELAQEKQPNIARSILFLLLERDFETAKRCFAWLLQNRSHLCVEWHQEFSLALAAKIVEDVRVTLS